VQVCLAGVTGLLGAPRLVGRHLSEDILHGLCKGISAVLRSGVQFRMHPYSSTLVPKLRPPKRLALSRESTDPHSHPYLGNAVFTTPSIVLRIPILSRTTGLVM